LLRQAGRLWIDADDAANIGGKAERQKPWSCSEVDQRMLVPEAQSLCHVAKEFSRIRRPQFPVQRNSGGEASHDRVGDPFVYRRRPVIESRLQIAVAKGLRECAPVSEPHVLRRSNRHQLASITFLPALITGWCSTAAC
jgi:hypothetical protein